MRRDPRGRALYRSRAVRRRRSVLVVVLLAMLAAGLIMVGSSGGSERIVYDRAAAVAYADEWALGNNPSFWSSPDSDCANFVSQCVAAGGLRPLDGPGGEWRANGTEFPAVSWVNCGRQKLVWSRKGGSHSPYIARSSARLPAGWRKGDVVYLGVMKDDRPEWQHVIICVGKADGQWVYDSHTTAYRHATLNTWYPEHFSLIRYCSMADEVLYE